MEISKLLVRLEAVERRMSDLYAWLSGVFGPDPDVAALFAQLAREERSHASLLEFQQQIVAQSQVRFRAVSVDESALEGLEAHLSRFETSKPEPSLEEAIAFCLAVEASFPEGMHRRALAEAAPDLEPTLTTLGLADASHARSLVDLAERRGLAVGLEGSAEG